MAHSLEQLQAGMHQHLEQEEQVLFPAIRRGARGVDVRMPIRVLMHEHDDHGEVLLRLQALSSAFAPPPEACATWRGSYADLEELEAELMQHIHLENNVLFSRALES